MARRAFEITTYHAYVLREGPGAQKESARILCRGADGSTITVYFVPPEGLVVKNYISPDAKRGRSFVPAEQFSWYMDLLRNEKPVRVFLDSDHPNYLQIYTGAEPVGEEEQV